MNREIEEILNEIKAHESAIDELRKVLNEKLMTDEEVFLSQVTESML